MAASSRSSSSGSSLPFSTLKRTPLAELPLRNFIERPPSPLKSYSSPGKITPSSTNNIANASSSKPKSHSPSSSKPRPSSIHVENSSSRRQLIRDAIQRGNSGTLTSAEMDERSQSNEEQPIKSPQAVKVASILKSSPSFSSPSSTQLSLQKKLSPSNTLKVNKAAVSSSQSLSKNKERIQRQLLDEDEDGGADADIRAGSPSPMKMKPLREDALRGTSSLSSLSSSSNIKKQEEKQVLWTVWQDEDAIKSTLPTEKLTSAGQDEEEGGQDKENLRPSFSNNTTAARKKGTGGRLSLLATGEDTDLDHTVASLNSTHEKRRRVTPMKESVDL